MQINLVCVIMKLVLFMIKRQVYYPLNLVTVVLLVLVTVQSDYNTVSFVHLCLGTGHTYPVILDQLPLWKRGLLIGEG